MKRVAAALLVVLAVAGCGGTKKPADPGRDVLGGFLRAAADGDADAMRGLLSPQSRKRLGDAALERLGRRLDGVAHGYRVVVSERITDTFGVAAVAAGGKVYAAALRKTAADWGLELGGPVRITPLGPRPGARMPKVGQIGAEVKGLSARSVSLLYLDGRTLDAKAYQSGPEETLFANLDTLAPAGRHTVVVFASDGPNASALAWTFVVPR